MKANVRDSILFLLAMVAAGVGALFLLSLLFTAIELVLFLIFGISL